MEGRSLSCIRDYSPKELWGLYGEVRQLKKAVAKGTSLDPFRLADPQACCYLVFMENSTRTKESFRNAAMFHGVKVNVFDCQTSSFQKGETVTDTLKMLMGYSLSRSIFVVRSGIEGLTRWLEEALCQIADRGGLPRPVVINAGDGRHEHPTQEILDGFTFWEHAGYSFDRLHVALIGDLRHGRTVHSKVDGLRAFSSVQVDLVAPEPMQLPAAYYRRMIANGFEVRIWSSIEEYLAQEPAKVAQVWYFTRLQLERMDGMVLEEAKKLRESVTFDPAWVPRLPEGTKFYHPLPRNASHPVIPFELDATPLNGYDGQSRNGYFCRIALLHQVGGGGQVCRTGTIDSVVNDTKTIPACANSACVSHPTQKQRDVAPRRTTAGECYYCDHSA